MLYTLGALLAASTLSPASQIDPVQTAATSITSIIAISIIDAAELFNTAVIPAEVVVVTFDATPMPAQSAAGVVASAEV
jgi:hypothetical protein